MFKIKLSKSKTLKVTLILFWFGYNFYGQLFSKLVNVKQNTSALNSPKI